MNSIIKATLVSTFILFSTLTYASEISIKISKKYLNIPVSHKQDRSNMEFEVNGIKERSFAIRLAQD